MAATVYDTLIDVATLAAQRGDARFVIVDCRFDLADPAAGRARWLAGHVPGAVYAHLDDDLSGPPTTDHGRHPLPPPARLADVFGALGIDATRQVVAYDDAGGMIAARLWWMLRYMGHAAAAVLDGGWAAWEAAGQPVARGAEQAVARRFTGRPRTDRLVRRADIVPQTTALLDAREGARYRGEVEPIDPRAGHIPGARNHCWRDNLDDAGHFLPPPLLAARLASALGASPDAALTHYCGSGVSACHNVLAQVVAGLPEPRLYVGSWSEWCRDAREPATR
ncbi:MAG: sulfurtransferase [Gammaproteobacteria bacterium]